LLIPFPNVILTFLQLAGIDFSIIDFNGGSLAIWNNVLRLSGEPKITILVQRILEKYPDNPYLQAYLEPELQDYSLGPDINSLNWKARLDEDTREKITGGASTLLPIRYLAEGLEAAKSVVHIRIAKRRGAELGSGFLIKGNLLITNHHVIGDAATALGAVVTLNYEEPSPGMASETTTLSLDPGAFFRTSEKEDWTAVRVNGPVPAGIGLTLLPDAVLKGDFVSIIQHPGGRYKQIALYHNIVTYVDQDIVQYLTDTEPGSSGSPVFNEKWEVIALHHSGGVLTEPGLPTKMLRNEGIAINKIVEGLK
jgi:hypothetical protein